MRAEIVPDEPAMLLKGRSRILLVSDLHLGLVDFYDKFIINKIEKLIDSLEVDELIVLGDMKHKIGCYEFKFDLGVPVSVIRGNHDSNLRGVEVLSSRGIRLSKFGLFHGHAIPSDDVMDAEVLIFGHAHPSVYIDGFKERVWLTGFWENKRLVVMPAFNDLCASTPINLRRPAGFMFRRWDYRKADVFLLDGTHI